MQSSGLLSIAEFQDPGIEVFGLLKQTMPKAFIYIQFTASDRPVQFGRCLTADRMVFASGDDQRRAADPGYFTATVKVQDRQGIFQEPVVIPGFREPGKEREKLPVLPEVAV